LTTATVNWASGVHLPTLSKAADMGTLAQIDVAGAEAVISSPSICIRRSEQCFGFRPGEESDQLLVMFLAQQRQDPLDDA
jgi:hypothetical protein